MFLPDHKKIVYIPHIEYRLIRELYNLSCEGVYYCLYKEYFDSIKNKFNTSHVYSWYCHTINAYYDLAIGHWCKIFGSYSEPTHYHKLLYTQSLKIKLIYSVIIAYPAALLVVYVKVKYKIDNDQVLFNPFRNKIIKIGNYR
jgi:hypothetical protein